MTTPKVILLYAFLLSLFISCGRQATNQSANEKRVPLARAANGNYYEVSCLKGATAQTIEKCQVDVDRAASGGRKAYGGYNYYDPYNFFLLDLGNFDPYGFCGGFGNIWNNQSSCYNFWGIYPWDNYGGGYGHEPPRYGCDINWAYSADIYFYPGGPGQNCGYGWNGGWGGYGYDDLSADPYLAKIVVTKESGAWRGEATLARRQGTRHALSITICPRNGNCSANVKWITANEVEQVKTWIRQIRQVRRQQGVTNVPTAGAACYTFPPPTQERTYSEARGLVRRESSPCGFTSQVQGAATDSLVGWLNTKSGF